MGKGGNLGKKSNDRLDDSETKLKSCKKKKIEKEKEKSSEKKVSFKILYDLFFFFGFGLKRLDDSETKLKSCKKKKIEKVKSSENKSLIESGIILNSKKKKIEKEESSENKPKKKKLQDMLLSDPGVAVCYSSEDKKPPKKEIECGFSTPDAQGNNFGNNIETIFVKGFDSSLPRDTIKNALHKHFDSCGDVIRVFVPVECETGALLGFAFLNLEEKDDIKKALALNGSYLEGDKLKLEVVMATERNEFYYYPYPNFKGCASCRIRDHLMRIHRNYYATGGGSFIPRFFSFLHGYRKKESKEEA